MIYINIIINNLHLYAYHGVNEDEKINGQNFYLDITAELPDESACQTDDIDSTVSYSHIIKKVSSVFTSFKCNLIEYAAAKTADCILDAFPAVSTVEVTLKKPEAPVKADFGYVAVKIRRERNEKACIPRTGG